jgi:hypothetical protein
MKKGFIHISFLIALTYASYGQDINVTAAFDTSQIYIGDQIRFTVTADQPEGVQLFLPEFKDTIIKNIEILSGPVTDSIRNLKGVLRIKKEYLITSFDSGSYQVQPVYAELKNQEGLKRYYSDYSYLKVIRPDIAPSDTTAKIFDVVAPYKAPLTLGELMPWILILLLIAVIAYFAVRFFRKFRKRAGGQEEIIIPDPAHIIAFRDLEKLREAKLWQKGEVKLYYTMLTEILRKYLENRFSVYSLELTTSETLEALVGTGFKKDDNYRKLRAVLSGSDMVKFAKYNPEPTENESFFQDAWSFVEETREREEAISNSESKSTEGGGES